MNPVHVPNEQHSGAEPIGEATQEHSGSFAKRSLAKSTFGAERATYPRKSTGAEPLGEATQEHSGSFAKRSLANSTCGVETGDLSAQALGAPFTFP